MTQQNFPLFLVLKRDYVVVRYDEHVHNVVPEETLDPELAIVAAKCEKCGTAHLLFDSAVEQTEAHERGMGSKRYYVADCWSYCDHCKVDLHIEASYSVYAFEWVFFDYTSDGCEPVDLVGLDQLVKEMPEPHPSWDEEVNQWVKEPKGFAMFTEGEDDKLVIGEFLKKLYKVDDLSIVGVHVFTGIKGGGKEEVVASARYVTDVIRKAGDSIPYTVVLDGDASSWASSLRGDIARHLFILSEKEVESYLLDSRAIAKALAVEESRVAELLKNNTTRGKEDLEYALRGLGLRPTSQVKQLIARHKENVPKDFAELKKIVDTGRFQ